MIIKRQIAFKLRPYGKDMNLFQIQMHTTFNSQRIITSTGCQINSLDVWNAKDEIVVDGYQGPKGATSLSINNELRKLRDQMETAFKYFEANDIFPTRDQIVKKYEERVKGVTPKKPEPEKKKETKPKEPDLFNVFDEFIFECGEKNAWTKATFQKMAALRRDLSTFKKKLKFSDLTEKTLTEFVVYLRDEKKLNTPRKPKGDRKEYDADDLVGIKNSTIDKKLGYLKWFLKWATDKGYNSNVAYKTFKPTLKATQKKVIYLSKDELKAILNLELKGDTLYLEPVRDI